MIQTRDLCVRFDGTPVLDGVTAEVPRGELAFLRGPNGAGKSTLLRVLAGLQPPSAGRVRIAGDEPGSVSARRRVGLLQSEPPLYGCLTVWEHVDLASRLHRVRPRLAHERAAETGLEPHADKLVDELSLGLRKRLGLLVATVHDPEVVLLDEPFNGLDEKAADRLERQLEIWREQGTTLVVATHDTERILPHADRQIRLGPPGGPAGDEHTGTVPTEK